MTTNSERKPVTSGLARLARLTRYRTLLPYLACASALPAAGLADTPGPASGSAAPDLEEIVVTATRRQESIDKVPVSITAFSQEKMDEQGVKSIEDVAKFTPGLTFAPSGDGLTNSIAIRGVSSGVGASTTGIYIDDTPIQVRSGTGIVTQNTYPQIFDLDRVEVLRGPQNTLFGTGSMGGTIRFITPEPDLHNYSVYSRAEGSSTKSGDPSYEMGAAAGGPLVDGTLGFRVSAFFQNEGGFINREPFNGTSVTDKGMNYNDTTVFRGALKFAPNDSLTITPSVYYQKQRSQDNYFWETLSNPSESDFNNGYTQAEPVSDKFTLPALNVHWRLDGMELISNTSYFYRDLSRVSDYSNFIFNVFSGIPTPTDPLPGYRSTSDDAVRQNSFTQEVRLQSSAPDSRLQWVAGALFQSSRLYTSQYVNDPQLSDLTQALFDAPVEDVLGEGLIDGRYSGKIDQWATDKQSALFGQVDYAITSQFKGTLGVRVARTTLDFNRVYWGPLLCTSCNGEPEHTGGSTPATTPVTPRIELSYQADDRNLFYVSASKGSRVGGVNNPSIATDTPGCPTGLRPPDTYRPDSLWSYEIGAKNQFADGHLRTQVSVYYIDWRDIQESVSSNTCVTASYKDNIGRAKIKGFDVAAEWRVIQGLSLSFTGGYSDAKYAQDAFGPPDANGNRPIIVADGDSLGVSPWNAVASGQYEFNAFQRPTYFRVDYSYIGKNTSRTPQQDPVTNVYDPGLVTDSSIRLLEARLGMRFGGVDVSVFGRNLLNDAPILGVNHDAAGDPLYYATTIRPRSIGLTATYRYYRRLVRSSFLAVVAVLAALSLSGQVSAAYVPPTLVRAEIAQGALEGESLGKVLAFRGIPYAAPPVENLRFQPPQPPQAWTGARSALDMGPSCPQLIDDDPTENNDQVMAEDCLSLNVWTPRLDARKRPVMVWIHGGAFVVGSSRNTWYDGAHLSARGDVVVVTLNYRLGVWGFLALEGFGGRYASSANIGLQDQVAALQWVRNNIAKFGGDPEKVTVFGESAGASSVGALLSMPVARGLFARAILESGVPSKRPVEARERSARLAGEFLKQAGVSTPDGLATKSMRDLLDIEQRIFNEHSELGTFVPWVDGTVLKEQPFAVVASGRGNRVPIMIGTTAEEMRYFSTAEDLGLEQKPKSLLMKQLEAAAGPRAQDVFNTYQRLYPNWGDMVVQISSDAIMRFPSIELAEQASAFQPVYMYLFTYRSNSSYKNFGSAHAMELPFVFGLVDLPEVIVFTGRDPRRHALADAVMDRWLAFARTGNPNVTSGPVWKTYEKNERATMELGYEIRSVNNPLAEQRDAWGGIYPTVEQSWPLMQLN